MKMSARRTWEAAPSGIANGHSGHREIGRIPRQELLAMSSFSFSVSSHVAGSAEFSRSANCGRGR